MRPALENIFVYRMTHIDNIPHILRYGITQKHSHNANNEYKPIGDTSLISFRNQKYVRIEGSSNTICLGDYIPFYFGVRMPMLYVIQLGGNFVPHPCAPTNIIYIAISLLSLFNNQDIDLFFSDGHATDSMSTLYPKCRINELPQIIDWEAIKARKWSGDGVPTDIKRRKQAELLVGHDIPSEYIHGFVCYDNVAKRRLIDLGINDYIIKVCPKAYY